MLLDPAPVYLSFKTVDSFSSDEKLRYEPLLITL